MNPVTDYLFGELKKMTIKAFTDNTRRVQAMIGDFPDGYKVMFNPNSFSQKFEVQYEQRVAPGNEGGEQTAAQTEPKQFEFEFLFDGTGAAPEPGFGVGISLPGVSGELPVPDVSDLINKFLDYTIKRNGDIHRPNYLKIEYGILNISCVLKSADVSYTLFNPDGKPLRAKVKCVFLEDREPGERVAEQNDRSPDLTHIREVNEGDNLSFISDHHYDDPSYYLDLARVNNLKNFRRLKVGTELQIPPIKNESNS